MNRLIVMVGLCCLLLNGRARAQSLEGIWISTGIGVGSFNGDGVDPETGPAGYIGAGVPIGGRVLVGAEGSVWRKKTDFGTYNIATTHSLVNAVVYLYLSPPDEGALFFKAVFGWAHLNSENSLGRSSANGRAMGIGLGYDLGIGDNFSLRAYVNGTLAGAGNLSTLTEVGVGVLWH